MNKKYTCYLESITDGSLVLEVILQEGKLNVEQIIKAEKSILNIYLM